MDYKTRPILYFIWSAVDVDNMYDSFIEIGNHYSGD